MTKLLVLAGLLILIALVLRRVRATFLASPRGQELLALWRLLRQIGGAGAGASASARAASSRGAAPRRGGTPSGRGERPISLIRCTACGTHVPEGSARRRDWGVFCSEACEHRARP